jgi:hypothetical protein
VLSVYSLLYRDTDQVVPVPCAWSERRDEDQENKIEDTSFEGGKHLTQSTELLQVQRFRRLYVTVLPVPALSLGPFAVTAAERSSQTVSGRS